MSEHTPEPWTFSRDYRSLSGPNGLEIFLDGGAHYTSRDATSEANSRRIVACVNACAGIPTSALKEGAARELVEALAELLRHKPAFRAAPLGAPNSHARQEQDDHIAAEDKARFILAQYAQDT